MRPQTPGAEWIAGRGCDLNDKLGTQYPLDNAFKKVARKHQSEYRANVLCVDFDEYGNRLREADARGLLNYYGGLGVREVLRKRYREYSKSRDADMLRSEHIPFNLFGPLCERNELARYLIERAFGISCARVDDVRFEDAPKPREDYLNDATAFDVYIEYTDQQGKTSGIGIEVKYTEGSYPIGKTEKERVADEKSPYWRVTRDSKAFRDSADKGLACDDLRQIWRNHLLGLSMQRRGNIKEFTSVILYPGGNEHFNDVIPKYQSKLNESHCAQVRGCTYEKFVAAITGSEDILKWKSYLEKRYLVTPVSHLNC